MTWRVIVAALLSVLAIPAGFRAHGLQAGRKAPGDGSGGLATLNVIVEATANRVVDPQKSPDPRANERAELYDAGILQQIEYFRPDYSPARIVFLIDNSETLRATTDQRREAVVQLSNQLYQSDQAMIVAFDQHSDVIEEFTSDKNKLKSLTEKLGKGTAPRLLDAIQATMNDALRLEVGISKRVVFLLSDGYDGDSGTPFQVVLRNLQRDNIILYAIKFDDRTRGAPRRKALKPEETLNRLTSGTGGRIVEAKQLANSARGIMREIAEQWYQLTYRPAGINPLIARRLLLIANDRQFKLRTKSEQPPERL